MDTQTEGAPAKASDVKVLSGVVPYLSVDGAAKAAELYVKAFGAEEKFRNPLDDKGRTMHIHLYINGGSVMLCDFYPEHGYPPRPPQAFTLSIVPDDVDFWWKRAVDAGLKVVVPLQMMFWGQRYGQLEDEFGFAWSISGD